MSNSENANDKLSMLRAEIDRINDDIYNLLKQRTDIVGQVGEYKRSNLSHIKTIMKPSRELQMVKNIYAKAQEDGYNKKISLAMANMWRNMISLSINYEEDSSVAVINSDLDSYYLAREYFGFYTSVSKYDNVDEAFKALVDDEVKIACFDVAQLAYVKSLIDSNNSAVSEFDNISIFVELPFFDIEFNGEDARSFAIAKVCE